MVMLLAKKKDNDSSTLTPEIIDVNERDNYLLILNDAINKLHHKAVNGKIRNVKNEKVKIEYYRIIRRKAYSNPYWQQIRHKISTKKCFVLFLRIYII